MTHVPLPSAYLRVRPEESHKLLRFNSFFLQRIVLVLVVLLPLSDDQQPIDIVLFLHMYLGLLIQRDWLTAWFLLCPRRGIGIPWSSRPSYGEFYLDCHGCVRQTQEVRAKSGRGCVSPHHLHKLNLTEATMDVSCQCGAVAFKTPLPKPLALYICHCSECRRQTSSAFGTSAIFPRFNLPSSELLSCYR